MNQERPKPFAAPEPPDPREDNGTGEHADEDQLGITEEEVVELEDDSKGG